MEFGFSKALVTAALRIADAGIIYCRFLLWSPWNRADHYIFALSFVLSSFFFPRLISAVADWMSVILPHNHDVALVRI